MIYYCLFVGSFFISCMVLVLYDCIICVVGNFMLIVIFVINFLLCFLILVMVDVLYCIVWLVVYLFVLVNCFVNIFVVMLCFWWYLVLKSFVNLWLKLISLVVVCFCLSIYVLRIFGCVRFCRIILSFYLMLWLFCRLMFIFWLVLGEWVWYVLFVKNIWWFWWKKLVFFWLME